MKKQKLTLNEEISQMKRMMGKLLNEYANLHLHDAIVEEINDLFEKMLLNKLGVSSRYDIEPDWRNNKYDNEGRLIHQEKTTHSHLKDKYDDLMDNFHTMSLADNAFDMIKHNYENHEIKNWNNRPVPDEVISYAKEWIENYLYLSIRN